MADDGDPQEELRDALKRAASALSAAQVPFALGGGYALWAYGAPEPSHDADLVVSQRNTDAAVAALDEAGFQVERPPESWLFKATTGQALVDVLHAVCGEPITPDTLETAQELQVLGVFMPVLPPMHVMRAKLLAMNEHYCDFGALLPVIRAVRERLDWDVLTQETSASPFAEAFLLLCRRLEIAPVG